MLKTLIGRKVATYDGHIGVVIKHFKPNCRSKGVNKIWKNII